MIIIEEGKKKSRKSLRREITEREIVFKFFLPLCWAEGGVSLVLLVFSWMDQGLTLDFSNFCFPRIYQNFCSFYSYWDSISFQFMQFLLLLMNIMRSFWVEAQFSKLLIVPCVPVMTILFHKKTKQNKKSRIFKALDFFSDHRKLPGRRNSNSIHTCHCH